MEGWHIDEIMNAEEYQKEYIGNNKKIFFEIVILRDRESEFEPVLIEKRERDSIVRINLL